MARKNYTKFSKKSEESDIVEKSNETMNEVFNEVMEEIVKEKPVEKVIGVVTGCAKLNVRKKAKKDAAVLCIIDKDAEVVVDLKKTTEEFYKVCTSAGVEGYCAKSFIAIKA